MAFDERMRKSQEMRWQDNDLILVIAYALITVVFSLLSSFDPVLDAVLGAGMVLFVSGYGLIAAVFPGKSDIGSTERAALSAGMSIMAAALAGLGLSLSPLGFTPDKLFICLAFLAIACAIIAYKRRRGLVPEERFRLDTGELYRKLTAFLAGESNLNKVLIIVMGLAILASLLAISWAILMPARGEPFTEFYLLGPDGKAGNYPLKFYTGEPGSLIVGIASHEYRDVAYDLVVTLDDGANTSRLYQANMTLASGGAWEKRIEIAPDRTGKHQKLEFLLYADGNYTSPYRDLRLWVDVGSPI